MQHRRLGPRRLVLPSRDTPAAELATLHQLAQRFGSEIVETGGDWIRIRMPPEARVPFLATLAAHDAARDPRLRQIAAPIVLAARQQGADANGELAALHRAVQQRVRYVDEAGEVYARPAWVWLRGYGDCDESAPLMAALAASIGHAAELIEMADDLDPTAGHVVARVAPGQGGSWKWAETTVHAAWDEHPELAARRGARTT